MLVEGNKPSGHSSQCTAFCLLFAKTKFESSRTFMTGRATASKTREHIEIDDYYYTID
jgi:hypothetical protein